jgi:hypothetical protein
MFILRRITTSDVPAGEAQPQMQPRVADLQAILTSVLICVRDFDLV